MEISYSKKSLIKIKAKFDPTFSSSLMLPSTDKQANFVKIIINLASNSKIRLNDFLIANKASNKVLRYDTQCRLNEAIAKCQESEQVLLKETNKFNSDILISPIFEEPFLLSIETGEKDYFGQIENNKLTFFELLKKKNNNHKIDSKIHLIQEPGEYEIKNTYIRSIVCEQNVYVIEIEKIKICCFWKIPEKELTIDQLSQINSVDILIFPYSNEILKDYDRVSNFIHQIDPSLTIIVEMLYNNSITEIETCEDDVDIDEPHCSAMKDFIKQIGEEKVTFVDKFKIQKKDIIQTNKNFIFLKAINNKQ